ncbi:DNA topoisomerase 3 [Lacticaseibacillus saniviri]
MKLVLAEKPSVGAELARVLGAKQKHHGYFEGNGYLVTWSLGHLLTLKMPEQYHPEWKEWSFETLPMIPERLETTPLKQTRSQLAVVKSLAKRSDIDMAVIATDAGREGELVARYIFNYLQFKKPIKRLWISSQTDQAIREGFAKLKPAKEYDDLYQAALARAEADWLVGLNVSRALTIKYDDSLSAGRVQTPTLAFVAKREQQINAFKPETYYQVSVATDRGEAKLDQKLSADAAQALVSQLDQQPLTVTAIKTKAHKELPPLLYDLNELQQVANQKFGYSPKQTLNYLQNLYEREKLVTYPRTDSKYLTTDLKGSLMARLAAMSPYRPEARSFSSQQPANSVFNNAKVGDHYGLIPTEQVLNASKLDQDELRIYRLIADRFLDLFKPAYQATTYTVTLTAGKQSLTLKETAVVDPGFKDVAKSDVTPLKVGEKLTGHANRTAKKTTPKPRLNEATLLGKMDQFGLGTPATRADIIEKLQSSELMRKQGRDLLMTPKGNQLLKLVNSRLVTPDLTAKWEASLKQIESGQLKRQTFMQDIKQETTALVTEIKRSTATYQDHSLTQKHCPVCDSLLKEKQTKQGVLLICTNPSCNYKRYRDPKVTNHRCSQCHKKMVILTGAKGDYFKCLNCGNTEAMTEAKGKSKRVNKREERKLIDRYSKPDEEAESPLAAALKAAMKNQ